MQMKTIFFSFFCCVRRAPIAHRYDIERERFRYGGRLSYLTGFQYNSECRSVRWRPIVEIASHRLNGSLIKNAQMDLPSFDLADTPNCILAERMAKVNFAPFHSFSLFCSVDALGRACYFGLLIGLDWIGIDSI